jgi:hypothetical protein
MVETGSVDFVFSFDSLVHADAPTLEAYLRELTRVLRPGGVAFLHHSNMAMYARRRRLAGWLKRASGRPGAALSEPRDTPSGGRPSPLPAAQRRLIRAWQQAFGGGTRAADVSAKLVRQLARESGLHVRSQEMITWAETGLLSDCLTVVERPEQGQTERTRVLRNRRFMDEAAAARRLAAQYFDTGQSEGGGDRPATL